MDSSGSGQGMLADTCLYGKEPPGVVQYSVLLYIPQ